MSVNSTAVSTACSRGFTLMEVLVALVLLTLFSLVTFRALDAVLEAQRRASAEMEHWRGLASTFARIDTDLASAVARPDPRFPLTGSFHIQLNEDGSMQFDLVRQLPDDADQALRRIGYRCGGRALERLVWADENNPLLEAKRLALLNNLNACAFRYLDELGRWQPGWQSSPGKIFPRGVELGITTANGTAIRRVFRVQ